jgi:prepilin-type N-terminal cleavage/methylation domain-containing protein
MRKRGFTFVEVAIVIALLGVVAAVTIPTMMNSKPDEQALANKKASVTLSQGVKTMIEDDQLSPTKEFQGGTNFCNGYAGLVKNSRAVNCNVNVAGGIAALRATAVAGIPSASAVYNQANLVTSSGEVWWGLNQPFVSDDQPITIIADVDGPQNGKNKIGEDVVVMSLYKNGKIGQYDVPEKEYDTAGRGQDEVCNAPIVQDVIAPSTCLTQRQTRRSGVQHQVCSQETIHAGLAESLS